MARDCMSNRYSLMIGLLAGFASALIGASWQIATRYGVTSTLLPSDLALLRYGVPTLVLSPLLFTRGIWPAGTHRSWFVAMICGGGIVFGAFAMSGARYSPVAHMGILLSGTMPLFTALALYVCTRVTVTRLRLCGYALIIIGALAFGFASSRMSLSDAWFGDLLFLCASFSWAIYTLALRKLSLPPWHATALVCFWSSLAAVVWVIWNGGSMLLRAPLGDVGLQLGLQGLVAGFLGSYIYALSVRSLGANNAAIFGAFVPVLSAIGGYMFLAEHITFASAAAIALVMVGILLARELALHGQPKMRISNADKTSAVEIPR
jgi:drug/metabolite transporter (DMT)-like permease